MERESGNKRLVVIDGKSVFYRGFYAMPGLHTDDGTPTGGVFGFATMALEVIKRLKPDYVAVAWDKPKTNIRKRLELYPEYKAGRKPPPPDFYVQIPILIELLDSLGWPLYELDDYEADDIMGTLALQAAKKDIDTFIITSDLDMLQIVNEHVKVYALKTGLSNIEMYSPQSFEAKYGLKVDQFLDLKSLKGDSSDNIPGVPGIGEKGAIELLKQFKTLDDVYDHLDEIKPSLREKLIAGKKLAYLSKSLASIWTDAPIKLNLDEVDGSKLKAEELGKMLEKLQFKSLKIKLNELIPNSKTEKPAPAVNATKLNNIIVDSDLKLDSLKLPKGEDAWFVFGRSEGKDGQGPKILALSDGTNVYSFDLPKLNPIALVAELGVVKKLIGYDLKSELKLFMELGFNKLPLVEHDIMIGAYLINSLRGEQTLSELADRELGLDLPSASVEDKDDNELLAMAPDVIGATQGIYDKQIDDFKTLPKIKTLAEDIEWPVIAVIAQMEKNGIKLDVEYLEKFSIKINDDISDLERQIYGQANQQFNISSPVQLAEVLFSPGGLNLSSKGIKRTKTSYSTAASELDKLRDSHPIIDLISQYREVMKLKNTYIDALPRQVDEHSRLHTTYSLTTAATGRLSSVDPNLQNIPIRTDLGRHIRTAFVAGDGRVLVSADYSQFELRLAAVLAGDSELIEMFNNGADIHTATAAQVYGRQMEDVTKQMRRSAKVINFGILYGMSPHGLSAAAGMTYEQAIDFINSYKKLRKPLFDYMDRVIQSARHDGYVDTMFGRRRFFPDINSTNFVVRQAAERAAINMPIQGTEADLMKMSMIKVEEYLKKQHNDCRLLLQIHDSVLVECPSSVADDISADLKEVMENIYKLPVKLVVDVDSGKNWGEL